MKTVCSLKLIADIGRTAIVIVHKSFLMNQWVERIKEYFDIGEDEIGIVRQDRCQYEGRKIVVAMAQSLLSRNYPTEFYHYFGTLVVDEVHRFAAPTFRQTIVMFPARYRIGVTATPNRADGLQSVFESHIGKIRARGEKRKVKPEIKQIPADFSIASERPFKDYRGKVNLTKVVSAIIESETFNRQVARLAVKAASAGRKLIIFSDRVKHLETLETFIKTEMAKQGKRFTIGFYIGGMKEEELAISATRHIILATYAMACLPLNQPYRNPITGERTLFSSIIEGEGEVFTEKKGEAFLTTPVERAKTGVKPCVRIQYGARSSILASEDHRILTDSGWKEAKDIDAGDYLAVPRILRLPEKDIEELTEDDMWLIGAMLGDGTLSAYQSGAFYVVSHDTPIVEKMRTILRAHDMDIVPRKEYGKYRIKENGKRGAGVKTWLREVTEKYGLGNSCLNKHLPESFMYLPESKVCHLLAGLIDADGCVSNRGVLTFSSSSERLVYQVRTLFHRLGVYCPEPYKHDDGNYRLRVPKAFTKEVMRKLPLVLERKRERVEKNIYSERRDTASIGNFVPTPFVQELKRRIKERGIMIKEVYQALKENGLYYAWLRQTAVTDIRSFRFVVETFKINVEGWDSYIWVPVKSVESVGHLEVGDMTIEGTHRYIFNDIVVHNCEGLDIPELDTCFLCTPKSDIEQVVGRITREHEEKKQPMVIDFVHNVSICQGMAKKRRKQYQKLGWLD